MLSAKNIFNITYPVVLTLVVQNIINVTDTAFLGRVGEVALGASAIGGVYFLAIYMLGFGFSQGAQIIIGRRNGEKNYTQIGSVFINGMLFIIALAFLFLALSLVWNEAIMRYLVSSPDIFEASLEYLDWRMWGFVFAFMNVMFRGLFVGVTNTSVLTTSALLTALTNVALDYVLIFGKWGFPEMGIAGAALASVIAEGVTTVYLFYYSFRHHDFQKYELYKLKALNFKLIVQMLELSVFIMFQYFISVSTWFLFFIFIERMGERPLAATNIGRSLYVLLMVPGSALAATVNTLVSNLIGAGRKAEVVPFITRMMGYVLLMVVPLMLITFLFPEAFARIYTNDAGLIEASVPVMKVVSVAMIFCALGNIVFNGVSGTGNTKTAFLIEFGTLFFYLSYVYYTAILNPQPVAVVWMSEFVYWTLIGLIGYLYLLKGNWQKKEL
ncbi:MAG: MATE family efflux transporter [Paludibacter sp. SCN 50-10]|nr:MAG: MATE family efflux transporter [Paludibacter sp. SCN 50-10]